VHLFMLLHFMADSLTVVGYTLIIERTSVGSLVGIAVGVCVGILVGRAVGILVGGVVGDNVGATVVGWTVGTRVGICRRQEYEQHHQSDWATDSPI
jgi:hypothetical protein